VVYAAVLAGSVVPPSGIGSIKPTAMESEPSEFSISTETINRRMSSDMSGPLSDKPDGTIASAQVTNIFLPAGERPKKIPHFYIRCP